MKTLHTTAIAFLIFLQALNLQAQSYEIKNYKMSVAGTSSLHDWESAIENIECNGVYTLNGSSLFEIKNVVLRVKVTDIKSTKGRMMDNKTYDAFNYEKNPFITFKLTTEKVNEAESTIDVKGDLTMAGVTKTIDMTISYKLLAGGDLQIVGSQILSMTDFGMEPPTAMMGTIKVGKEVTVKFELTLTNNNKI
jgi:hypothetical protein